MDDHASKSINIFASIAIALVIIGIVITGVNVSVSMTNKGIAKASKLAGQMDEITYTQYDGELIKGDQVIAIIKQFQDDTISICVKTGNSTTTKYIYDGATFNVSDDTASCTISGDKMTSRELANSLRDAQDPSKSTYVAPTKNFLCSVCRHPDTQGITGLYFELQ